MATKKKKKVNKQELTKTLPTTRTIGAATKIVKVSTDAKKLAFLEVLPKKVFHVSDTCTEVGIHRGTYYLWMRTDPLFKRAVEDQIESLKDFAESCVIASMPADWKAAFAWLKIHAKDRGYKPDAALATEDVPKEPITIRVVYDRPPKKVKRIESEVIDNERKE